MRRYLLSLLIAASCQDVGTLPSVVSNERIRVDFSGTSNVLGTAAGPLPITFGQSAPFVINITMLKPDGSVDTSFNSWVRLSSHPGQVYAVNGGGTNGRNVQLTAGMATNVQVVLDGAYGATRIWVQDLGVVPTDPTRAQPPACANGIDDNHNGLIDYPADPGCYSPNDDSEDEGTGATGVSDIIYYAIPRVADVRGAYFNGGTGTPFSYDQVTFNTGYDPISSKFSFDVVVTGLASNGFFFTDLQDQIDPNTGKVIDPQAGLGYGSIFAYTFVAPLNIGVCDRIRTVEATTSDFYGYTEGNFPTWETEVWDPNIRPCLVPEPTVLAYADWSNTPLLFKNEAGLVRVQAGSGITLHVGAHIGAGHPGPQQGFIPYCDATGCYTNCDLTNIGKVDYSNANDAACATACTADVECTEYANYSANGGFDIVMSNGGTTPIKVQGNAQAAPNFDPVASAGKPLTAFTGELTYFSGGSQFTIQARCNDDVITDPNGTPKSSANACIARNGTSDQQL